MTVTVDNSINYMVSETDGAANITLLLDQESCQPVIITVRRQVRPIPNATGSVFLFYNIFIVCEYEDILV